MVFSLAGEAVEGLEYDSIGITITGVTMQRIRKIIIALTAMLMIAAVPLAASTMTVTWEWLLDDPEVTAYRYQLGGEDPDGWTVIGGDVNTLEIGNLDPAAEYTLYLQRSYDGENWSESASSTASATIVPYTPPAEEVTAEETPAEAVPAEETAVEEEPLVKTYENAGFTLTAYISEGETVLEYPASVADSDVHAFFALENEKYGLGDMGVVYRIEERGRAVITYPSEYTKESVDAELDLLFDDLTAYLAPAAETAETPAEETPAAAEIPSASDESRFAVSLLLRAGIASTFDDTFTFSDTQLAEVGLGLDFSNILSVGDNFGFGLRSDFIVNFLPTSGAWDLEDTKDYFNVMNYAERLSLDLKLMADFAAGPAEIYLGGGAGFSVVNPDNAINLSYASDLGTFKIGDAAFGMDWFASAVAGLRFHIGSVFSIGAEVGYRYLVEAEEHLGSADIVLGFTF